MSPLPSPPEQQLLDLLHQHPSLGNAKARELLQWSESQYEVVKANLVLQGLIIQGRGRGGSIKLAVNTSPEAADHLAAEPMDLQPMGPMGTRPPMPVHYPTAKRGPGRPPKAAGLARLRPGPTDAAGLEPGEPSNGAPRKRATLERGEPSKRNGTAFEQAFRNIDDALWKDPGCTSELDYTEQTSWILFLKYLDDLETVKQMEAELQGKKYTPIIEAKYRWPVWACPKDAHGKLDRFPTGAGFPGKASADWGWAQHIYMMKVALLQGINDGGRYCSQTLR